MAGVRKVRGRRAAAPLTRASLEHAALAYLERFASSSANLRRVLLRKVARAARRAEGEETGADTAASAQMVEEIIARYIETGLLNDRAYASQAAASLARRGASRFGIAGKLRQKGVEAELLAATLEELDDSGASELAAACALVRRRRLGPYREGASRAAAREKDLASLARAGFSLDIARRVLGVPDREALERLARGEES